MPSAVLAPPTGPSAVPGASYRPRVLVPFRGCLPVPAGGPVAVSSPCATVPARDPGARTEVPAGAASPAARLPSVPRPHAARVACLPYADWWTTSGRRTHCPPGPASRTTRRPVPSPVAARSRRAFEPGHLLVAPAGAGMKVEVETVLGRLGLRHPLEEQPSPEPPAGRLLVRVVRMPDGGQIPPLRGGRATRWSGPRGLCPAPADPRRVRGPVAAAPCVRRRAVRPRPPWGGASSAHGRSAARARRRAVRPSPIARRQAAGSGRRAVDDPGTAGASGAVPAAAAARASAARRAASARVRRA